jgi:hypothetical protein
MLELRCGNWLWYNSALASAQFGYNQYQPQRDVKYSFIMLMNKIRQHKDRVAADLAPLLPTAISVFFAVSISQRCKVLSCPEVNKNLPDGSYLHASSAEVCLNSLACLAAAGSNPGKTGGGEGFTTSGVLGASFFASLSFCITAIFPQ